MDAIQRAVVAPQVEIVEKCAPGRPVSPASRGDHQLSPSAGAAGGGDRLGLQEKAIAHPTDARLTHRAIEKLVELAKREGVELRQSYLRLAKRAAIMVRRYTHAHQFKRATGTEVSAHAAWPHHP